MQEFLNELCANDTYLIEIFCLFNIEKYKLSLLK